MTFDIMAVLILSLCLLKIRSSVSTWTWSHSSLHSLQRVSTKIFGLAKRKVLRVRSLKLQRVANAHRVISAVPKGYHTFVGEPGTELSVAHKQSVAIAKGCFAASCNLVA